MAYYNNIPQYYQSAMPYGMPTQNQMQANNGIIWAQGEQNAKSYPVAPGQSAVILDSEADIFYIKSVDQSGKPLPLRIFDFTERKATPSDINPNQEMMFITKAEFDQFRDEIRSEMKRNNSYKPQYKKKED